MVEAFEWAAARKADANGRLSVVSPYRLTIALPIVALNMAEMLMTHLSSLSLDVLAGCEFLYFCPEP